MSTSYQPSAEAKPSAGTFSPYSTLHAAKRADLMAKGLTAPSPGVERLNGGNYASWAYSMQQFFRIRCTLPVVLGDWTRPKPGTPDEEIWESANNELTLHLAIHCEPDIQQHLYDAQDALEQWKILRDRCVPGGTQALYGLVQELMSRRLHKGSDLEQYFTRHIQLIREITGAAQGLDPWETIYMCALLNGLTDEFTTIRSTICALPKIGQKEAIAMIRNDRATRVNAKTATPHTSVPAFASVEQNQTRLPKPKGKGKQKGKPQTCGRCQKRGHNATVCNAPAPVPATDKPETRTSGTSSGPPPGPRAIEGARPTLVNATRFTPANAATSSAEPTSSHWIWDTGAAHHITGRRDLFQDISPIEKGETIYTASGQELPVAAIGTAVVPGASWLLTNVWYVPGVTENLVSASQLEDHKVYLCGNRNRQHLRLHGEIVWRIRRMGRLYALAPPVNEPQADIATTKVTIAFSSNDPQVENSMPDDGTSLVPTESPRVRPTSFETWHARLGHAGSAQIRATAKAATGISISAEKADHTATTFCEPCVMAKQTRAHHPKVTTRVTNPLGRVYIDFWGPCRVTSIDGERYMLTFTDECTRMLWVVFTTYRNEDTVRAAFVEWRASAERDANVRLERIRADNAPEFNVIERIGRETGFTVERTAPYTPEQNGIAERMNRTILEKTRAMLRHSGLPLTMWTHAAQTAAYLRNRCTTNGLDTTPFERFFGKKPNLAHLRAYGCNAYALIPGALRGKLDETSRRCALIGYTRTTAQYLLWESETNRRFASADVQFDEGKFSFAQDHARHDARSVPRLLSYDPIPSIADIGGTELTSSDLSIAPSDPPTTSPNPSGDPPFPRPDVAIPPSATIPPSHDETGGANEPSGNDGSGGSTDDNENGGRMDDHGGDYRNDVLNDENGLEPTIETSTTSSAPRAPEPRRSGRERRAPVRFDALSIRDGPVVPADYRTAMADPVYRGQWESAINDELAALEANGTWTRVARPMRQPLVSAKWVFQIKRRPDGAIDRFKARLVARGFTQRPGIDFNETYAPTVNAASLRLLLAIATSRKWHVHHADVSNAYLNGVLNEKVFLSPPEGLDTGSAVLRLNKGLYGLKQSGRVWSDTLSRHMTKIGFSRSRADPCVYFRQGIYIAVYVDDFALFSADLELIESAKRDISSEFKLKDLGPVKSLLGYEIAYDRQKGEMRLGQRQLVNELLEKHGMADCHAVSTPIEPGQDLHAAVDTESAIEPRCDRTKYQEIIGSLNFLATRTRPDLSFSVGLLARYSNDPTEAHFAVAKRILRYLRGTVDYALQYRASDAHAMIAYTDADYAGDKESRRSTSGCIFMLARGAISWFSRRQSITATSTMEAEYTALAQGTSEAVWFRLLLGELGLLDVIGLDAEGNGIPIPIYVDNTAAIAVATNPRQPSKAKHIDIRLHVVQDRVEDRSIRIEYIGTDEMQADGLTKGLPRPAFQRLRKSLGILGTTEQATSGSVGNGLSPD